MRRSDVRCISIRPSWVQWEGNIERNLGPLVRGEDDGPNAGFWAYTDAYDLAQALRLAAESNLSGHEVFYIAQDDNSTGRPLADLVRRHHGDAIELRELRRPDASGISCEKARRLLGWRGRPVVARLPGRRRARCGRRRRAERRRRHRDGRRYAVDDGRLLDDARGSSVSRAMTRRWICDVPS